MDISGVYVFPEPFIEQRRITQCFKCQKFGHISRGCKNDNICSRCSGAHRNINCQLEIKCNGPHPSNCNVSGSFVQVFFFREQSITGEPSNAMLTNDRKTRGVKIAHWNINRVFNKTAPLFSYLKNYHIHVLSLNETWLKNHIPSSSLFLFGYNLFRLDRVHKSGGGVCFACMILLFAMLRVALLMSRLSCCIFP